MRFKTLVDDTGSRAGRLFNLAIQGLIVLSLISFSIETLPNLSPATHRLLYGFEVLTVAVFTVEYVLRVWAAENKRRFIFSFFGIVDLLAILPFYLFQGVDLRSVRVLRLFRLVRIFKLFRYGRAMDRFQKAFLSIREELILYLFAAAVLFYLFSVGIYYFESPAQPENFGSVFHCMWWAVVTFTTVGYGDVYPITTGGRVFTGLAIMIGIGTISVPSGLIASALTKVSRKDEDEAGSPPAP